MPHLILGSIAGALLLSVMRSVLEVTGDPADPATFAIAAGVIVAVSAAAVWMPMRRASNADALAVLRAD